MPGGHMTTLSDPDKEIGQTVGHKVEARSQVV